MFLESLTVGDSTPVDLTEDDYRRMAELVRRYGDLRLAPMQELAQRIWAPGRRFHIGDLAWQHWSTRAGHVRTRQWSVGGTAIAGAWVEPPGHLEFLADPDRVDIAASVMDWFEETTAPEDRACIVMSGDINTATELQRRGYSPASTGPYFLRLIRDLADLPAPITPPDYTIRHVRPGQAAQRAAVHRAGWSDFNSDLPAEDYAHLMQTYPYRPELDLVVAAPDDTWVASALGWYDPVNRVGLVEPVSCVPAHRRRGLATALNIALLHAFTDHGATTAVILPRGDDAYPAPRVLYEAIGYQPHGARTVLYT